MVKLNLRKRKNQEEEILEDVDLTAIVEQKRRQQQEQEQETKTEIETKTKADMEVETQQYVQSDVELRPLSELLQDKFVEWLVEEALKDDVTYRRLEESIDRMRIEDLRVLCRALLRKLRER